MASRLQSLNGWRRLWLVATAALAIWFVVVGPLRSVIDPRSINLDYHRYLKEEFDSGRCQAFQTAELEALPAPVTECALIYFRRKDQQINAVPYTLEAYDNDQAAMYRQHLLTAMAEGAVGTAIVSGLVYFLGWLVGWVLAGFRPQRP